MNIRKHWKKVILSCAAAFWASCGDDTSTKPIQTSGEPDDIIIQDTARTVVLLYGVLPPIDTSVQVYSSSSENTPSSSEVTTSSSETVSSSSSAALSSAEEITSSSSEEKAGIRDTNLIKSPAGVRVGDKFIADGDTCEVVSIYDNWFGGATGNIKGLNEGAKEINSKIDSLTKNETISDDKQACFENIKTMLDRGVAIYGPMPEDYPQEVKCSDGIVKETEHYKARLKEYNEGFEEGFNETIKEGNEMIDECQK